MKSFLVCLLLMAALYSAQEDLPAPPYNAQLEQKYGFLPSTTRAKSFFLTKGGVGYSVSKDHSLELKPLVSFKGGQVRIPGAVATYGLGF